MAEARENSATTISSGATSTDSAPDLQSSANGETIAHSNINSARPTPYVSAESSNGRGGFHSAPGTPMHFVFCLASGKPSMSEAQSSGSFEFQISSRFGKTSSPMAGAMSSADELFLNGQIRPMKLSPVLDLDETEGESENAVGESVRFPRRVEAKLRDRPLRRRTKSMLPLRTSLFNWHESDEEEKRTMNNRSIKGPDKDQNDAESTETTPSMSTSSSRSSSTSRSSRRWTLLDFLNRSKSEGRNYKGDKFWSSMSLSPVKNTKAWTPPPMTPPESVASCQNKPKQSVKDGRTKGVVAKASNGRERRRLTRSPHELHYTVNRAHALEMRKKTFLPYRQGLLSCLGFSSKSYGALNGFARTLNPVSSR
ncbi:hypothetical protein NMG60_11032401 [Bertholletia excelsa]